MRCSKILAALAILAPVLANTNAIAQARAGYADAATTALPRLVIDASRVAVTGISSGAFMATQIQLAYPELFPRAAILAGGPYDCASVNSQWTDCLYPNKLTDQQLNTAVKNALDKSKTGSLGDFAKLANGRVYVLYGTEDKIVGTDIAGSVAKFYRTLKQKDPALASLAVDEDGARKFGHTFPIYLPPPPQDCDVSVSPYLGHCRFDAAQNILRHLYPDIATGSMPSKQPGILIMRSSETFGPTDSAFIGNHTYVYVPKACGNGTPCGMLLVLHGCNQNDGAIGTTFVRAVGFNRWADDYRLVIVYPQTQTATANYGGCWDWWGYSGQAFDTRKAPQMAWLANMIKKLTAPTQQTGSGDETLTPPPAPRSSLSTTRAQVAGRSKTR